MPEIICADCGHPRRARNRNTRYCHKCRLLRSLEFHRSRTHKCRAKGCSNTFAPLDVTDRHCGAHALGYSTLKGTCRYCSTEDAFLVRPDVPCCIACVRDPSLRERLITALQKGQAHRKSNPPKEASA